MEVKELRIGNLVNCLGNDYEVSAIGTRNDVIGLKGRPLTAMNLVNGIVLTEDWLIALGFEKKLMYGKHDKFYYIKDKLYYCEHYFYSFVFSNENLEIVEPKYVHQLQNLYFALTGKELQLNEQTN